MIGFAIHWSQARRYGIWEELREHWQNERKTWVEKKNNNNNDKLPMVNWLWEMLLNACVIHACIHVLCADVLIMFAHSKEPDLLKTKYTHIPFSRYALECGCGSICSCCF